MKLKFLSYCLFAATFFLLGLNSCIKDEEPYKEADIEGFSLKDTLEYLTTIPQDSRNLILVQATDTAAFSKHAFLPYVKLSSGAHLSQSISDSIHFVKNPATESYEYNYKVIAQDGSLEKSYTVRILPAFGALKVGFEKWTFVSGGPVEEGNLSYYQLSDPFWDSANEGAQLALNLLGYLPGSILPEDMPSGYTTNSHSGHFAAKLTTYDGMHKYNPFNVPPLIPGTLFKGYFKIGAGDQLTFIHFGQFHPKEAGKPVSLHGYYMFKPGPVFHDERGNPVPNKIDSCAIYAVMFKVAKGKAGVKEYLDGSNILTSDKIVAKAIASTHPTGDGYEEFSAPFLFSESLDYTKYDYKLTIVFSSSAEGNLYRGAPQSVLCLDDVEVSTDPIL